LLTTSGNFSPERSRLNALSHLWPRRDGLLFAFVSVTDEALSDFKNGFHLVVDTRPEGSILQIISIFPEAARHQEVLIVTVGFIPVAGDDLFRRLPCISLVEAGVDFLCHLFKEALKLQHVGLRHHLLPDFILLHFRSLQCMLVFAYESVISSVSCVKQVPFFVTDFHPQRVKGLAQRAPSSVEVALLRAILGNKVDVLDAFIRAVRHVHAIE